MLYFIMFVASQRPPSYPPPNFMLFLGLKTNKQTNKQKKPEKWKMLWVVASNEDRQGEGVTVKPPDREGKESSGS